MTNNLDTSFSWEKILKVIFKNEQTLISQLPKGDYGVWVFYQESLKENYLGVMDNSSILVEVKRAKLGGNAKDKYKVHLIKIKNQ